MLIREALELASEGVPATLLLEAKALMYHGTSSAFLRTILKKGLDPNSKQKVWDAEKHRADLATMGGVYFAKEYMIARGAATTASQTFKGDPILVGAIIQSRTGTVDEDILPTGRRICKIGARDLFAEEAHRILYGKQQKSGWRPTIRKWIDAYIHDLKMYYKNVPERRLNRVRPLVHKYIMAYLKHLAAQYKKGDRYGEDWAFSKELTTPELRKIRGQILKALPGTDFSGIGGNVRILDPVTYRGANRILFILRFKEKKAGKGAHIVVEYGKPTRQVLQRISVDWGRYILLDKQGKVIGRTRDKHAWGGVQVKKGVTHTPKHQVAQDVSAPFSEK